jgi:outer membrane lipoprotein-sorting protein
MCWVFDGTPKVKDASGDPRDPMARVSKVKFYIGQSDLLLRQYMAYDKGGNEMMNVQFSNSKVNGKVDRALFKYTPPPGAHVMDMTKGRPGMPDLDALKKMIPTPPEGGE